MKLTILDDHRETIVDARMPDGGSLLIRSADIPSALGWERKPQGWCRGDICIPARVAEDVERDDGWVDLAAFADLIDRPYAEAPAFGVAALGVSAAERESALAEGLAPDFELRDVDGVAHTLGSLRGRKVALVFWASWCGCRYDLAEWERQHVALRPHGFSVVSIAADRRPEDAEPWIREAGAAHVALIDVDGEVADRYQVLNVPTVVWIDEEGRVVRPNDTQFATDLFRAMSGLDSARAMAALRRWVLEADAGLTPDEAAEHAPQVTAAQQQARTEAAVALWLHRAGHPTEAAEVFARAEKLAPEDVTIWRGAMPLLGTDPMGDEYFRRRQALTDAGIPIYRPLPDWQGPDGDDA
ncbi:MAG: redoxin domain-containing protein [Catenulispora sp.]